MDSLSDIDRRVNELLKANNREVERRRDAEAQVNLLTLALAEEQAEVARLRRRVDELTAKLEPPPSSITPDQAEINGDFNLYNG